MSEPNAYPFVNLAPRQHKDVGQHGGEGKNGKRLLTSRPTFNKWITRRTRTRMLDKGMLSIIQSWVNMYGNKEEESEQVIRTVGLQ